MTVCCVWLLCVTGKPCDSSRVCVVCVVVRRRRVVFELYIFHTKYFMPEIHTK